MSATGAHLALVEIGDTDVELAREVTFEQFVEVNKDSLVNYLTNLTGDRDHAEETAQESFLRVYRTLADVSQGARAKSYLYTTATNLVRSHYRRAYRWAAILPRLRAAEPITSPASPQSQILEAEIQGRVRTAIEALPLRYKAPLLLRDIEGWSYEEIAESLECAVGTIKSRINRARNKLKVDLAAFWNGEE